MKIKKLSKKKVAILGFGREGKSSLGFLLKLKNKNIALFDDKSDSIYEFSKFLVDTKLSFDFVVENTGTCYIGKVKLIHNDIITKIHFEFGKYKIEHLKKYEVLLKSPGISPYDARFIEFQKKFTSQTQIFYANYGGKIIGVTGTKGKSTTTTLIYEALKQSGLSVKLVGNIGLPVFDEIDLLKKEKYDFIVYEMSSYMLDNFEPKNYISLFNNIFTCHLDWHKTWENYLASKCNIIKKAKYSFVNNSFQNLFFDRKRVDFFGTAGKYYVQDGYFYIEDKKILPTNIVHIPGNHNLENIAGVIGVLHKALKSKKKLKESLKKVLSKFTGLPHRLENIGVYNEITFINDAIAVTPEATIAAIKSFGGKVGTIFLGGKEAGYDFSHLEELIKKENIENIVIFPDALIFKDIVITEDTESLVDIGGKKIRFLKTKSMRTGVKFAYKYTKKGNIALLSCAAQSFSLWRNFEVKGDEFKKYVKELS